MRNNIYAYKNSLHKNSSSGGAFPDIVNAFKKYAKMRTGSSTEIIVYGAAFNDNMHVQHIRAVNEIELQKISGSKYVTSRLSHSISDAIDDLKNGRWVVFSGTPCQIEALNKAITNNNIFIDRLLRVDIICHGTPKPKYWEDYINWLEKKNHSNIIEYSFRYSKPLWLPYSMMVKFRNGKVKLNSMDLRSYLYLFFSNLLMQEGCYHCKFSNINRVSDITIGDFWGIEKCIPDFIFQQSVSEIIINTNIGEEMLHIMKENAISNNSIEIREYIGNGFLQYQHNLIGPTKRPDNKDSFDSDYASMTFEDILKKYGNYSVLGKMKFQKLVLHHFLKYLLYTKK